MTVHDFPAMGRLQLRCTVLLYCVVCAVYSVPARGCVPETQ